MAFRNGIPLQAKMAFQHGLASHYGFSLQLCQELIPACHGLGCMPWPCDMYAISGSNLWVGACPHISVVSKPFQRLTSMANMNAWKAEDLLQEINSYAELSRKRPDSQMLHTAWGCLEARLKAQECLSCQAYLHLMDEVEKIDMESSLKEKIVACLDQMGSNSQGPQKLVTGYQSIASISAYLTETDWKGISSTEIVMDVLRIIAVRLRSIGMVSLTEQTKKQSMGIVLWWTHSLGKPLPSAVTIYNGYIPDFADLFHKHPVNPKAKSFKSYPSNPGQLGEEWIASAYTAEDKPSGRIVNLAPFLDKIATRKTSHLLKQEMQQVATPQAKPQKCESEMWMRLQRFLNEWDRNGSQGQGCHIELLQGGAKRQPALPTSAAEAGHARAPARLALPPLPSVSALPLADGAPSSVKPEGLAAETAAVPNPAAPEVEQPHGDSAKAMAASTSLKDFEEEAFQKLQERGSKKPGKDAKKQPVKKDAVTKSKAQSSKPGSSKPKASKVYGCLRCRGNPKGCSTCWADSFAGQRFQGRDDYNRFVDKHKAKGKVYK